MTDDGTAEAASCTCTPGMCSRGDFRDHQGESPGCMSCADLDPGQPCYAGPTHGDQVAARLGYLRATLDAAIRQPEAFDLPVLLGDWGRALDALGTVLALSRDSDGNYLRPDCYVPVGGFQSAVVDALTGPDDWKPDPAPDGPAPDYLRVFADFWAPIVQRPDGTLNFGQIARELADYRDLMGWTGEVYCSVTGGRISKVNTLPSAVIGQAEECTAEAVGEAIDDLIAELEERESGPYSTPQIVRVIREITGREQVPDEH